MIERWRTISINSCRLISFEKQRHLLQKHQDDQLITIIIERERDMREKRRTNDDDDDYTHNTTNNKFKFHILPPHFLAHLVCASFELQRRVLQVLYIEDLS